MGRNAFVHGLDFISVWKADIDVGELEPEARVDVGSNFIVCLDDILDVNIDKVIEGIDMLLDETFDFEKGGQQ